MSKIKLSVLAFCAAVFAATLASSCATLAPSSRETPRWVTDTASVYPNSAWLVAVERASTKEDAEAAALNALARIFRTDVTGVTNAYYEYAQGLSKSGRRSVAAFDESREFAQNVETVAQVSGLIGLVTESAQDSEGVWWANARMNRAECAAVYEKTVHENEALIESLQSEAARNPGTFDAYCAARFALVVAEVTDDVQAKLAILDTGAARRGIKYGSADAMKAALTNTARSVLVDIKTEGSGANPADIERISKAFSGFLSEKGFRTGAGGVYTLTYDLSIERVDLANSQGYSYFRYVMKAGIRDREKREVFSYTANGREGHINETETRQRVLRSVEEAIKTGGFAESFDAFLAASL